MENSTDFAVVIPVLNEEGNIYALIQELAQLREELDDFEVIIVDDHSSDQTNMILNRLILQFHWLHVVRLRTQSGQSIALHYGISRATRPVIVTLDGDGQNDPADIKQLVATYRGLSSKSAFGLVTGCRRQRKDSWWRIFSSTSANTARRWLLKDNTPDSGCGIKVFSRELFLSLPFFNHMHRFLPALVHQRGGVVVSVEVNHRQRSSGRSHYGTFDRLHAGIVDVIGVLWLGRRAIPLKLIEEQRDEH